MSETRLTFGKSKRLRGRGVFKEIMDARARVDGPAIAVHARPNQGSTHRLGISIGRRVGSAALRNRIKRLIREAFRLQQHEFPRVHPAPYDLVVVVRQHEPLALLHYSTALSDAVKRLHATWQKRATRHHADQSKDS